MKINKGIILTGLGIICFVAGILLLSSLNPESSSSITDISAMLGFIMLTAGIGIYIWGVVLCARAKIKGILRITFGTAGLAAGIALAILGFYTYNSVNEQPFWALFLGVPFLFIAFLGIILAVVGVTLLLFGIIAFKRSKKQTQQQPAPPAQIPATETPANDEKK